jgi:hypothetical protein
MLAVDAAGPQTHEQERTMAYPTAVNSQITDTETDTAVNSQITDSNTVNPMITDAVATSNVTSIASQPAMLSNLAFANLVQNVNLSQQNAVSNQQAMNQLGITVTGKVVNLIANLSPLEAASATHVLTGNTVAEDIADLRAALEVAGTPSTNS